MSHPHHDSPSPGTAGDAAARWDDRYGTAGYVFGVEPNGFVASEVGGLAPGRALDLACGEGRNAVWLAGLGWTVTAVDISAVALEKAAALAATAGVTVEYRREDLAVWSPEPGSFDLVVLSYLHVPAPVRQRIHRAAMAALAPGGRVVLAAHHIDNLERGVGGPQDPAVLFDEEAALDDFAGLDVLRCEEVVRTVDPGGPGEAVAVDLVFVGAMRSR